MKALIRLLALGLAVALVIPTSAQQKRKKSDNRSEKKEIVISKNGDKKEKMTIVVDGDNVTINGKSVDEYEKENGSDVRIIQRSSDDDRDIELMVNPPNAKVYSYSMPRVPRMPRIAATPRYSYRYRVGDGETTSRAFLGVTSKDNDKGAEITSVNDNTAASKAGLEKGDIITKLGGKLIEGPSELLEAVKSNKPNDEVEIVYLHDGKEKKAKVKLGETKELSGDFNFEMPEMPSMAFNNEDWGDELKDKLKEHDFNFNFNNDFNNDFKWKMEGMMRPRLGAKISDLEEGDGVKVMDVETDMAGAKAGLQKDDVITEIDGKTIKNTDDAREALKDLKEKTAYQLKVKRGTETKTLDVKVPKKIKTANL